MGQYVQQQTDSLRDDSRTGAPILIATSDGVVRSQASRTNLFHGDVLLSYQPSPGTVILAGYGSDMTDERALGLPRPGAHPRRVLREGELALPDVIHAVNRA